jgi:succinate dehydrogenase / fumarate reductase cytochrome b subunit
MHTKSPRPVFLDLRVLGPRMPLVAILSILNRATGALMFLSAPFLVWLLGVSLDGEAGYARAATVLDMLLVRLWLFVLIWSVAHHMLAGIRFLLLDIDVGGELPAARKSAVAVLAAGAAVAAITLIGMLL